MSEITRPTGQQIVDTWSRVHRAVATRPELELVGIETLPNYYGVFAIVKYQRHEYRLYCEYKAMLNLDVKRRDALKQLGRDFLSACERARVRREDRIIEYVEERRLMKGVGS